MNELPRSKLQGILAASSLLASSSKLASEVLRFTNKFISFKHRIFSSARQIASLLTLLVIFGGAMFFFYLSNGANIQGFLKSDMAQANRQWSKVFVPTSEYHGWIAWWDGKNTIDSLATNRQKLKTVSPVWYKIDSSGLLITIPHTHETDIKVLSQQSKTEIMPTVTNDFEPLRTSVFLHSFPMTTKLIDDLIHEAKNAGYQGYDIDFEEVNPVDQPAFEEFISRTSVKLHAENLKLAVTVHAQTGRKNERDVVKSYNLAELSKSADYIKVMAYDFHSQNTMAGAITPLEDLEAVLKHTSALVSAEKIIMGLPTYGYDWNTSDGGSAQVVTFTQAQDKIASFSGKINRDKYSDSLVGRYQLDGKYHEIWFEDAATIETFIKKSRSYGIYQFSFWRIGAEDPALWKQIPNIPRN